MLWNSYSFSSLFPSTFMDKRSNFCDLSLTSWVFFLKCFNMSIKSYKGRDNIYVELFVVLSSLLHNLAVAFVVDNLSEYLSPLKNLQQS